MTSLTAMVLTAGTRRIATTVLFRPILLAMASLLLLAAPSEAQEGQRLAVSDTLWEVRLVAGETYVGQVLAISGDSVTLETATGTRIQFPRGQAVRVRPARGSMHGNTFWPEDPNQTRLFFSPSGRTLKRGEGYFGVYELFIPFVAYGVTDRIMIAGGSPFYLAFANDVTPPLYIGPKIKVLDVPDFEGSLGALAVVVPDDDETYSLGIVYGVGTYGNSDNAITAGIGWGYVEDDLSSKPVLMLGGERRVGRYVKLMTENLFVPGSDDGGLIYSAGIRFFAGRLSADAALAGITDWEDAPCPFCIPVVNFVYHFGGGSP